MANFNGTILTQAGRNLLAKALTGAKLEFTKVQLGDGIWDSNTNPETLTSLISPKIDLPINDIQIIGDGTVKLRVLLTNTGLTEGFFIRELGIFAKDPNTGEEVLYAVAYAENPDFIPSDGVTKVESVFDVYTVVANAQNVTAVISDTVVLATKQDIEQSIETHNQDTASHPDIRQKLDELQNQIDNIGEGITPDIQNAINQHNQDPNAHEDIRATLVKTLQFWKKVPRNPTPDDIPPAENALWLNTETGEIFVCIKTCNNKAVWKGQFGTLVAPSTVTKFDIFEDGSAVALYRFDGNLNDDGGQYNITDAKNYSFDAGKFNQGIRLRGATNTYATIPIDLLSLGNFSVTLWVKPLEIKDYVTVFSIGTPDFSYRVNFMVELHNDKFGIWTEASNDDDYTVYINIPNPLNKWILFYIERTQDYVKAKAIIEGQNYEVKTETYPNYTNNVSPFIGKRTNDNSSTLQDAVYDQLRIFNRPLTDEKIQILYKEMEEC